MSESPLLASLAAAVEARPDDVTLRVHLAGLLLEAGRDADAVAHLAQALQRRPTHEQARSLMLRAVSGAPHPAPGPEPDARPPTAAPDRRDAAGRGPDWAAYERELSDVLPPRFLPAGGGADPVSGQGDDIVDVEVSRVRLSDVGGMAEVKKRLELAFLAPLRNPRLRALYHKSLRGGLLLYGPPGCGKTFLARAVAGEMGARFVPVSLVDVLDMWMGNSERNLHEVFQAARRNAPCVLFIDEIDAIGHKRSQLASSGMRTVGNQLLTEMDGLDTSNDGVFILAATNAPWDVDPALRRPGRLDRMLLVAPPDAPARAAILEYHLRERPVERVDLRRLVAATDGWSGADLAHLCDTAAEYAMYDSARTGTARMIGQADLDRALREVRPSIGSWFGTARNVALFANEGGVYDDLAAFLKKRKML